ncbi:MAG: hypothetical protein INQ03_02230 [Candidatus Heimdallarchaeota archaeon]|nr:hypothetical protein [Candidatus Heimdallarchaeota archaeon]
MFEKDEQKLVIFGGLTILLYILMYVRTVSMVFILNFGGGGLNATVLLFFATMSGFLYSLIYNRIYPHSRLFLQGTIVLSCLSVLLTLIPYPAVSLIFAVLFQLSVLPVMISTLLKLGKDFVFAAAIGLVSNIMISSLLNFSSVYATLFGNILLVTGIFSWGVLGYDISINEIFTYDGDLRSTSSLLSFIFIEMVFIGNPSVLSTWLVTNPTLILTFNLVSIVIGTYILSIFEFEEKNPKIVVLALYIVVLSLLVYVDVHFLYYLSVLLIQILALSALRIGIRERGTSSIRRLGAKLGGMQFLFISILFLQIGTPYWTQMPLPTLLRGNATHFMFLLGIILPISALRSLRRQEL